ncbi:LysR family transcriptional regulator [Pseudobacteriovorax antillogorgiicola]|uniref:Transcriptional regulator, LysR family n=1 Tax=Pseudobacteriovorax antillogorgiicola TaxID=1513793 RepID=A0A1Y6BAR5_9BACT|nr:LysR family transcriptional regulator [Pseudobacteriovorax antillogorgiicola]TCS58506.1 LysR family transcriptional regulator [Pseudobacteriovorax antillogorgiicola]SME98157.1 transcriptional regulator, LysR family [Pseudobacteriovorax antillogorgiicola]
MIDSNSLILFVKIYELGSFSAVAKELRLAKSVVSQRISSLEEQLNVRLLNRTTRKVTVTDEGIKLLPLARNVAESVSEVMAYSDSFSQEPSGRLRVTAPHDIGYQLLEEFIPKFRANYPKVQVDFRCSNQYLDLIQEQIDVAIRVATKGLEDSSYISKKLFRSRLGLYASPNLDGIENLQKVDELVQFPVIQRTPVDYVELNCNGKIERVNTGSPILVCNDMYGAMIAARSGIGVALLPLFLAEKMVASGDLVPVLQGTNIVSGSFHLIYPSRRHIPRKTQVFLDMLWEQFNPRSEDTIL